MRDAISQVFAGRITAAVELVLTVACRGHNRGANCYVDVAQVLVNSEQGFMF